MSALDYFQVPTAGDWTRLTDLLVPAYMAQCTVVQQAEPILITGKTQDNSQFIAIRARAFTLNFALGGTQAAATAKITNGTPDAQRAMLFASNAPPWVIIMVIQDILNALHLVNTV